MEVVTVSGSSHIRYQNLREMDLNADGDRYRINRGINAILNTCYLPFDYYTHLNKLATVITDRPPATFEGGCGLGRASEDLKRGGTFNFYDHLDRSDDPPAIVDWLRSLDMTRFEGLGQRIRTVGITLTGFHAQHIGANDEAYRMDRVIVGPLGQYAQETAELYDFVFDPYGPGFHCPREAALSYPRLMQIGAEGIMRVADGFPEDLDVVLNLMDLGGVEVIEVGQSLEEGNPLREVRFQKVRNPSKYFGLYLKALG